VVGVPVTEVEQGRLALMGVRIVATVGRSRRTPT
jgi:hypothetical protein